MCMFPAEVQQVPLALAPMLYIWSTLRHIFYMFVLFVGDFAVYHAPKHSSEVPCRGLGQEDCSVPHGESKLR